MRAQVEAVEISQALPAAVNFAQSGQARREMPILAQLLTRKLSASVFLSRVSLWELALPSRSCLFVEPEQPAAASLLLPVRRE